MVSALDRAAAAEALDDWWAAVIVRSDLRPVWHLTHPAYRVELADEFMGIVAAHFHGDPGETAMRWASTPMPDDAEARAFGTAAADRLRRRYLDSGIEGCGSITATLDDADVDQVATIAGDGGDQVVKVRLVDVDGAWTVAGLTVVAA